MNKQFTLSAELDNVIDSSAFEFSRRRFAMIIRGVQREVSATPRQIVDFINGGTDGWDVSNDEQQDYYDTNSVAEIVKWLSSLMYDAGFDRA